MLNVLGGLLMFIGIFGFYGWLIYMAVKFIKWCWNF